MATNRRTYINADEELIIQGKLTVEGELEQKQTTILNNYVQSNFEGEQLIVNSDGVDGNGDAVSGTITLNYGPTVHGNITVDSTGNILVPGNLVIGGSLVANIDRATYADFADSLTNMRTFAISGDASAPQVNFDGTQDVNLSLTLADSGVSAGSYGSAAIVPVINVDSKGRVTSAVNTAIAITSTNITDFSSAFSLEFDDKSTTDLVEGDNLYYTQDRFNSAFDAKSTTDLVEGDNEYFTVTRARQSISVDVDGDLSYNETTGVISFTERTDAQVRSLISAGGDLSYDSANGIISFTERTDAQVRGLFIGNSGINYANATGVINVDDTVVRTSGTQSIGGTKTFTGTIDLTGATTGTLLVPTQDQTDSSNNAASTAYVRTAVADLIANAPAALNTLNELAAALNDDANIGGIVSNNTTRIGTLESNEIIAGAGLTGGGTLSEDRTINIGSGTGIDVAPDSISVNPSHIRSLLNTSGDLSYNSSTGVISFTERTDAEVRGLINTSGDLSYNSSTGVISFTERTDAEVRGLINAGSGITYSDSTGTVSVNDNTVVLTSSNQSIAGIKTFTGELVMPQNGIAPVNEGSIFHNGTDVFVTLNGVNVKLTPQSDVGEVEDAGTGEVDIYAGVRIVTSGNGNTSTRYHGIRSLSSDSIIDLTETANVITVGTNSANLTSAIRNAISVNDFGGDGSLGYNSSTGVISYTGPSASEVRSHFSAGTGISIANGVISNTLEGYAGFSIQTESGAGQASTVDSNETLEFEGGTNITVTNVGNKVTIRNDNIADITDVVAGAGLTGGGNNGDVTLNVGAGYGISVSSDEISVDGLDAGNVVFDPSTIFSSNTVNVQSAIDNLQLNKLDVSALTTAVTFFPTTASSNVSGYIRMVTDTADPDYNNTAVDFDTGDITGNNELIGQVISDAGVLVGNTTPINVTIVGQVRRTSGLFTSGDLYFEVYKRNSSGTETLIGTSATTIEVDEPQYEQFSAMALIADTTFTETDRVVFKWYANANSGTFRADIQIGGSQPVRGLFPVPVGVVPVEHDAAEVTVNTSNFNGILSGSDDTVLNALETIDDITTSDVPEGTNQYFTADRARDVISAGGDLAYNSTTGVISFTERTDAQVRGLISGGTGISYNNATGEISLTDTGYITAVNAGNYLTGGGSSGIVTLNVDAVPTNTASKVVARDSLGDFQARRITADLVGTANFADQVKSTSADDNVNTFTFALTGGGVTANKAVFHDDDLSYVPSSNTLTVGKVVASNQFVSDEYKVGTTLTLESDGTTSEITEAGTGAFWIKGSNMIIADSTGNTKYFTGISSTGQASMFYGNGQKLRTVSDGVEVIGDLDATGDVTAVNFNGVASSAKYADLAEKYTTDEHYEAGTVVVFGGDAEVSTTDKFESTAVAGVISTDPAYMMNSEADGQYVALRGRVPCKVIGPVKAGDVLVTSNLHGYAKASLNPHMVPAAAIVGKAIRGKDGSEPGVVEILV